VSQEADDQERWADDRSDLNQAEQRLRASEEHFRFLVENTSDIVAVLAPCGEIAYVSPSGERMLGHAVETLVGRNAYDLLHEDDVPRVRAAFDEMLSAPGFAPPIEYRVRHPDGRWLTIASVGRNHGDGRLLVTTRDLTQQRAAEVALARRERRLHERQKVEALGWLAAGVAHDFNNLLHVIRGNAALLELELADEPALRARVCEIGRATTSAAELSNQLLNFSRRRSHDSVAIDVRAILLDLEPLLRRVVPEGVSLSVTPPPHGLKACFEHSALEQVVMNLVLNAADASAAGDEIAVAASDADGHVTVSVTDTGTGMSDETVASIFEPLFTTKTNGRGTGLGLAVVKELVEKHRGAIAVETAPGRGSRFSIRLHRAAEPPLPADDPLR
jgi:two-component system cell cycle sensor histidine kinase/response regulator CckA